MDGLRLSAVRKFYGNLEIVKGIELEVARGEFIVILGPSGCGKSTLLRMVAGLEDVSSGEIMLDGVIVTHLPPRRREVAMVFQNYALYPHLSVRGNIAYPLRVAGIAAAQTAVRVAQAAEITGLSDLLDRKPSQLSGGQRQRVAMARAIIRKPKIFLFDEPLSNLDAKLRVQMRAEIRELHRRIGATSVFVTHDQVEAMTLADRIAVMNQGRIEQIGKPVEVYQRPATRFVAAFVGSQPMSFLPAQISADGRALQVGDYGRLALSGSVSAGHRGKPVDLGLRAENLSLQEESQELRPDKTGDSLTGTYRLTEELGPHAIHTIDIGGVPVLVEGRPQSAPRGQTVGVLVDPAQIHLFDPDDGRRIELGELTP